MNGSQGAGCCCHHHCPYCSGYAAGFADGMRAARPYWQGPYWMQFHTTGYLDQSGQMQLNQASQMLAAQAQMSGAQQAAAQGQCAAQLGQLGNGGLYNRNGGQQ